MDVSLFLSVQIDLTRLVASFVCYVVFLLFVSRCLSFSDSDGWYRAGVLKHRMLYGLLKHRIYYTRATKAGKVHTIIEARGKKHTSKTGTESTQIQKVLFF